MGSGIVGKPDFSNPVTLSKLDAMRRAMDQLKHHPTALLPDDLLFTPCGTGFRSKCRLESGKRLHLGCGNVYQLDWLNVDGDVSSKTVS